MERIKENLTLYAIMSPVLVFIFVLCYIPMYGLIIAFQNYLPGSSMLSLGPNVEWVGLQHFVTFISSTFFWRLIRNTFVLSGLTLGFGFTIPIVFALLLNEVRLLWFKKFLQTASYLPYFISLVVVASMALTLIARDGLVNRLIAMVGLKPVSFTTNPTVFPWVYVVTSIWKSFGWSSVIYMAAISGVDPALYEAAKMDGANRFRQMAHITLPAISGTIFILLIFSIGGLLNANSELVLLMYNPAIYETSDVIGTYSYRVGIQGGQFSRTTAIGMFVQVINFGLLYVSNAASRRIQGYSLW
jgi:putative aldouronate transport system permease protein